MVVGIWVFGQCDLQRQFLNCIQLTAGPSLSAVVAIALHTLLLYAFVFELRWSVFGAAAAMTLSFSAQYLFMLLHLAHFTPKAHAVHNMRIWPTPHEMRPAHLYAQLKFGLACTLPNILGLGAFELLILMSAYLGPAQSSATVVGLQIENVTWACAFGICVAAVSLVGFQIGAGNSSQGKNIATLILWQTLVVTTVICLLIYAFNRHIVTLYTDNTEIVNSFSKISLSLALLVFFDFFVSVLFGIIKALAKQTDLFIPIFVSYYLIGFTL